MSSKNNLQLVQNQPHPPGNNGTKASQHDVKLIAELELFKNSSKKSWNLISKDLSLSAAVVSTWRKKEYLGDIGQINDTVRKYLEMQYKRKLSVDKKLNFVPIKNTNNILNLLETTQVDGLISAIIGDTGTSKTTSIEKYKEEHRNVIHVSFNGTYRFPIEMLRVIHQHPCIGGYGDGTLNTLCREIGEKLEGKNALIILDQCDYMNLRTIDIFRTFNDEWDIGICFVGLPPFLRTITGIQAQVRQISSRINPFVNLELYTIEECRQIVKANLPEVYDISDLLYKKSGGSLRILSHLIYNSKKTLLTGKKVTEKIINKYLERLVVRDLHKQAEKEKQKGS